VKMKTLLLFILMAAVAANAPAQDFEEGFDFEDVEEEEDFKFHWEADEDERDKADAAEEATLVAVDEDLVSENVKLDAENKQLQKQIKSLASANKDLAFRAKNLERESEDLRATIQDLKSKTDSSEPPAPSDSSEVEALRKTNSGQKNTITQLRAEIERLEIELSNATTLKGPDQGSDLFRETQMKVRELDKQIKTLKVSQKKAKDHADEMERERDLAEESLRAKDQKLSAALKSYKQIERDMQNLEKKVRDFDSLEADVASLESRVESQKDELKAQAKEIKRLSRGGDSEPVSVHTADVSEDNMDLYFNLAVLYVKTGDYKKAEKEFLKLLRLQPDAADIHYNLGILYDDHLDDSRKAIKHYKLFVELKPDSDQAEQVNLWLLELEMTF